MTERILSVNALSKHFSQTGLLSRRDERVIRAVDRVTLEIAEGQALGVVGESGCGKSTLARCIVGLYQPTSGSIRYRGSDLWSKDRYDTRARREIQMVFQDQSCLNPRMTIQQILSEPLDIHGIPREEWTPRIDELLHLVQMDQDSKAKYPRQLSGGQVQRIIIARALALEPSVLIADEPVSKLDVSIQSHILNALRRIKSKYSLTLIYISHDLATVDYLCDQVAVMYLGRIVEFGTREVLYSPQHPYTQALVSAVPARDATDDRIVLPGSLPDPANVPKGCRFNTRCPFVQEECFASEPILEPREHDHLVRCHFSPDELEFSALRMDGAVS